MDFYDGIGSFERSHAIMVAAEDEPDWFAGCGAMSDEEREGQSTSQLLLNSSGSSVESVSKVVSKVI